MKISCPLDLPIKKKVIFQLDFTLQEEPFSFKGKIIRKEETIEDTIYAIRFINAENPSEVQRLTRILNKIELERNRKQSLETL